MLLQQRHWGRCGIFAALLVTASIVLNSPILAQDSSGTGGSGTSETADGTDEAAADGDDPGLGAGADRFEGERIVRVEEDWLIDIAVTDTNNSAPEVCTVFGPGDPYTGLHSVFEMNHSTYPTFIRGGMQLQSWWGNYFLSAKRHYNQSELLTTVERIQYTCVTRINDNRLTMEVTNGDSVTYGSFGGEGWLRIRLWTHRDRLNSYDPDNSIKHSRVTFGANRVIRFVRTEVRYYTADGDVIVDEEDTYVHQLASANESPAPINE
ncbi:MAG: hypothetical protein KDA75_01310 [Planctomycetaceae bacterium]|nr:hypothetical protein [Planctomycetaceae bacterium]